MSGYRFKSDCRSRGCEFDPGPFTSQEANNKGADQTELIVWSVICCSQTGKTGFLTSRAMYWPIFLFQFGCRPNSVAEQVFQDMEEKTADAYNSIVRGLCVVWFFLNSLPSG